MKRAFLICLAVLLASICRVEPAAAQAVTPADVEQLRDVVFETATDLGRLRTGDAELLGELRARLNALRLRAAAFGKALREQHAVSPAEYAEVRDGVEAVRRRARGDETANARNVPPAMTPLTKISETLDGAFELPEGTELDVRLLSLLDLSTVRVGDRFEVVTPRDLTVNGEVAVPAGSLVRGVVTAVEHPSAERAGTLSGRFDYLTVHYRAHPIRATLTHRTKQDIDGAGRNWQPGTPLRLRFEAAALIARPPKL